MKTRIGRLTALIILICAAVTVVQARRVLLPPPDGYKGVEINGIKFVVGQVYIPQFADTVKLKDFGFRGFEALGSTHTYKKVKAIWPLDTDLHALPEWISGLSYEKARSVQEMRDAYSVKKESNTSIESVETLITIYGDQYNNYGGIMSVNQGHYKAPGDPNYRLNNYGFYNDGNPRPLSFNDRGARYYTRSPTLLTPTEIGSYHPHRYPRRWYYRR